MSAGDNTKDDRWRPGFASSERRVREELADADAERRVFSRELSFVPAQSKPKFEAHDAQTRVMIEEQKRLEQLRHGESVVQRLDKWNWMNRMSGPAEKQAHLEPLIQAVRRDPVTNEDILVFLLIAFEPIRRGVSAEFMRARGGLATPDLDIDWANRAEARMVREIDKQTLYDVTRNATIEALFRYPSPPPDRLFPWLRETISWRALDQLRSELSDLETTVYNAAEAEALQAALADLDQVDPPAMGEAAGLREWRRGFRLRSLYETVEAFYDESAVRQACTAAVGRLPRRQAEVIDGLFFQDHTAQQLAIQRDVSRNTIYNTSAHAKRNLHEDDCFFAALYQLGIVRDRARAAGLAARYPSGRLPDGRRIVSIDRAA